MRNKALLGKWLRNFLRKVIPYGIISLEVNMVSKPMDGMLELEEGLIEVHGNSYHKDCINS